MEAQTTEARQAADRQRMIEDNVGLVKFFLGRMVPPRDRGNDDLIAEGYVGLIEAVDHYKPDIGKFSTYAYWYIRGRVLEALKRRRRQRIRQAATDFTLTEKADRREQSPLEAASDAETVIRVRGALSRLAERDRVVLSARFGLDGPKETSREIGERIGVTQQRVAQIEGAALIRARNALTAVN